MTWNDPRLTRDDPRLTKDDPRMTQEDPRVTLDYPRVTHDDLRVTQDDPGRGLCEARDVTLPSLTSGFFFSKVSSLIMIMVCSVHADPDCGFNMDF